MNCNSKRIEGNSSGFLRLIRIDQVSPLKVLQNHSLNVVNSTAQPVQKYHSQHLKPIDQAVQPTPLKPCFTAYHYNSYIHFFKTMFPRNN